MNSFLLRPAVLSAALLSLGLSFAPGLCAQVSNTDFDGDDIPNATDLDDDNDGIPDAVENPCVAASATGTAPALTTGFDAATALYTDFGGYWFSDEASDPTFDDHSTLLALTVGTGASERTYATGVTNARMIDGDGDALFESIDTGAVGGTVLATEETTWRAIRPNDYIGGGAGNEHRLEAEQINGNVGGAANPTLTPNFDAPSNAYLYQGDRGMDLAYGMANIGTTWTFKLSGVSLAAKNDDVHDIIINQVAQTGDSESTRNTLYLLDEFGGYLGTNGITVDWTTVASIGRYDIFQYKVPDGGGNGSPATKDIRMAAVKLSAFGVSDAEVGSIAALSLTIGTNADLSFVAVNETSFAQICDAPDADGDGIFDDRDTDSDNDGIPDAVEAGAIDADLDGRADYTGTFASNDADGDGLLDAYDPTPGGGLPAGADLAAAARFDADGDGVPNYRDLDSDGDGITDVVENAAGDETEDAPAQAEALDGRVTGFDNGGTTPDGYSDTYDSAAENPGPTDTDGDGVPDFLDLDADNDGLRDDYEHSCATCPGYGGPATASDADANGLDDAYEQLTYANAAAGANAGTNPASTNTTTEDYRTVDSDGDGFFDWSDGFDDDDAALDQYASLVAAYNAGNDPGATDIDAATDTDSDGVPDFADNRPSVAGYDETARPPFLDSSSPYFVDANGNGLADVFDPSVAGGNDAVPAGGTAPFFRNDAAGAPVPVELLSFRVEPTADCSLSATWSVGTEINVERYAVESSADGRVFTAVATLKASAKTDYAVALPNPGAAAYYRLVSHDVDGASDISDARYMASACAPAADFTLAPNYLASGSSAVLATNLEPGTTAQVVDVAGRVVAVLSVDTRGAVAVPALAQGFYVMAAGPTQRARLVVR